MKRALLSFIFFFFLFLTVKAQNYYWIAFKDKNGTTFSIEHPEEFLSERAIQRRINQNISIDSLDLPVSKVYVDSILSMDVSLVHASKWLNGITVQTEREDLAYALRSCSFVKYVQLTKPGEGMKSGSDKFAEEAVFDELTIDSAYYGGSVSQVGMLNGQFLHEKGFRGNGMLIAVIDAGFYKANELPAFDTLWAENRIVATHDFVDPASDIWSTHYHGMTVLSCMGGTLPGQLIGTSPDASFILLRSEDANSEYIIEEDNWAAAAEFADSAGVDVINSSLGYYTFDDPATDHSFEDMDGATTRVTQAANIAASRGMMVISSAGNERDNPWLRIIAPSDGEQVIGVGAVDTNLVPAFFSSAGPAADGAVKPNVAAMGYHTTAQLASGNVGLVNGTSFSSPVMAGMAASLWQMFRNKTAAEIKVAIEMSASQYTSPDSLVGYGIPNMKTAAQLLGYQIVHEISASSNWEVFPNPVQDQIIVFSNKTQDKTTKISLYSLQGRLLKSWEKSSSYQLIINDLPKLETGIYLLRINDDVHAETFKINVLE